MFQPKDLESIAQQQYTERLYEAEQMRLINRIDSQADLGDRLVGARYWLGDQMIKWGRKLRHHHQEYKNIVQG
jgi:hypothetical protein